MPPQQMSPFPPAPPPTPAAVGARHPSLDRLVGLAAAVLASPIAVFCVAVGDRVQIRGAFGLSDSAPRDIPLASSACRHVLERGAPFLVEDARGVESGSGARLGGQTPEPESGARLRSQSRDPGPTPRDFVAYLGVPVCDADGALLGSLAVIDRVPRRWTDGDVQRLGEIAASVMTALALRDELAARRAAEARATDAEGRLASTVERLADAFVAVDRLGRFTYVNAAAERLFGRPRDVLLGVAAWHAFPDRDGRAAAAYREAMATGTPRVCVAVDPRGSGHYEVRVHPGPDGLTIQFRDVTAQLTAESALRSSEQRFRSLIEEGSDLVTVIDAAGVVSYVSPAVERALGTGDVVGREAFSLVVPDDEPMLRAQFARLLADPSHVAVLAYRCPSASGGQRLFEGTARNLLDVPGVRGVVVNVTDVTERRALEARLRHAQKLEAIGLLAGGIAHDFNNLLTVIRGNLEFLRDAVVGRAQAADDLAEAEKATTRATTLVRQLLAFGQRQARQPAVIDLNAVVADAERMVRRVVGEQVAVEVELAPALWAVRADRGQMEQVLMNLAVNARDAMPNGGALAVETANVAVTPGRAARWGLPAPGDYVRLTVRDTGTGMDDATKARLFEPFFTTKEVGQGTGLGLAVVYGIVAQSGGAVHVESALGAGSEFAVYLPRVRAAVDGAVYAPPAVSRGTGTILLVEDEPAVRRATRRTLERGGYRVLEAQHGADALLVWAGAPPVDAVVTDARMPGIDGVSLVARLRAERPDLPVLFVSGYATDTLQEGARLDRGVTRYLEKPFAAGELLTVVQELLAV